MGVRVSETTPDTRMGGLHGRVALFDKAEDILDDYDGIIDHETDRDGDGHQGQVIQAVVQQVHHAECAGERQRHRDAGDKRGPKAA